MLDSLGAKARINPLDYTQKVITDLIADVATFDGASLEIRHTTRDGLVAYLKINGKTKFKYEIPLQIINEETQLPLESKVEWDDTKELIQQRYPQENWNTDMGWEVRTHQFGLRPKKRTNARPFSEPRKRIKRKRSNKRIKTEAEKRKEEEVYKEYSPWQNW